MQGLKACFQSKMPELFDEEYVSTMAQGFGYGCPGHGAAMMVVN